MFNTAKQRMVVLEEKTVWRSIRFPKDLAHTIEVIAEKERRSFSAQALIFLEEELKHKNSYSQESPQKGQTRIDPEFLKSIHQGQKND